MSVDTIDPAFYTVADGDAQRRAAREPAKAPKTMRARDFCR
jgi:hypothetical protein